MYEVADISVTPKQLVSLWKGRPVQISADALKNPNSRVFVHPLMAKKISSAVKKGTGCRVCMSQDEILRTGPKGLTGSGRMSGMGWWSDAWEGLKKAARWVAQEAPKAAMWVKENIIDTPLYQEKIRPKVEGKILDTLSGLPYADTTRDIAQAGFDVTGIGMRKGRSMQVAAKPKAKPRAKASKARIALMR